MKILPIIYTDDTRAIVQINGTHYDIDFELHYDESCVPQSCTFHKFNKTNQPLTQDSNSANYVRWRGAPDFRQGQVIPTDDDGVEYSFLCTINNNWGDSGTVNIFVLIKDNLLIYHWVEASCS